MTTKQIDYCIELAHTQNFSRAADNLFVSQPTFSYQIRLLEEEVGFTIFERSGRGAALTPAGAQFVTFLTVMRQDLKRAIEQGQNFSVTYRDSISICMMVRQALYFLPEAMRLFAQRMPEVQITPLFQYENSMERFLQNEADIVFALKEQTRQVPGIRVHDLFESRIHGGGPVRPHADGGRRVAPGAENGPAPADRHRQDPLFQQRRPRHHAHQRGRGTGRMPCAGLFERPQRPVRLGPLRLQGDLLLRPLHPQGGQAAVPLRVSRRSQRPLRFRRSVSSVIHPAVPGCKKAHPNPSPPQSFSKIQSPPLGWCFPLVPEAGVCPCR